MPSTCDSARLEWSSHQVRVEERTLLVRASSGIQSGGRLGQPRTFLTRLRDLMPDGPFQFRAEPGGLPVCLSEFFGAVAAGRTAIA